MRRNGQLRAEHVRPSESDLQHSGVAVQAAVDGHELITRNRPVRCLMGCPPLTVRPIRAPLSVSRLKFGRVTTVQEHGMKTEIGNTVSAAAHC